MHSKVIEPQVILQAWGLRQPSRRGPQARVDLAQVVAQALRVADSGGMEAVTLAAVAKGVGLTTTALYRHVDSKELLEELVVDAALGPAPGLTAGGAVNPSGGAAGVHAWIDALWARYQDHTWLPGLPVRRAPRCPNAYAWLAALVNVLDTAGVDRPMSTALAIDTLTRGYAQQGQIATTQDPSPELAAEITRRHPVLAAQGGVQVEPLDDLHATVRLLLTAPPP